MKTLVEKVRVDIVHTNGYFLRAQGICTDTLAQGICTDTLAHSICTDTLAQGICTDTLAQGMCTDTLAHSICTDTFAQTPVRTHLLNAAPRACSMRTLGRGVASCVRCTAISIGHRSGPNAAVIWTSRP